MAKNLINRFLIIFLVLSLVTNLGLIGIYLYKLKPQLLDLENQLKTTKDESECERVYSVSEGKILCLAKEELKSKDLTECTNNFLPVLEKPEVLESLKDINELTELRDFSIETCMMKKGYKY